MKPSDLTTALTSFLLPQNITAYIQGPPGGGKTSVVKQAARAMGDQWGLHEIHAPSYQEGDFGIPLVNTERGTHTFTSIDWWPCEGSGHPERGTILFDEAGSAETPFQKAMGHMIQARTSPMGVPLLPGWGFAATGNCREHRAGAVRILTHVRDRMVTINMETDLEDTCRYFLQNGGDPGLVSFLRFRPGLICDFDPNRELNATARGWLEKVNPMIVSGVPEHLRHEMFTGAVGEGPAAELAGFLKLRDQLPDPDYVVAQPDKASVPSDTAAQYAMAGAIATRATPKTIGNVLRYAKRMPAEFTILILRDALARDPSLTDTKEFADWTASDGARVMM